MKYAHGYAALKKDVGYLNVKGSWQLRRDGRHRQYRAESGEILNYWESTGTVSFQGRTDGPLCRRFTAARRTTGKARLQSNPRARAPAPKGRIPSSAEERHLLKLIAEANASGKPITPRSKEGRYIGAMDTDVVRDLRGRQFEREVREAFSRATSPCLGAADRTAVDEGEAMGLLIHVAAADLVAQFGPDHAAEALLRIVKELRRYGAKNLRKTILNLISEAVYDLY